MQREEGKVKVGMILCKKNFALLLFLDLLWKTVSLGKTPLPCNRMLGPV